MCELMRITANKPITPDGAYSWKNKWWFLHGEMPLKYTRAEAIKMIVELNQDMLHDYEIERWVR